MKTLVTYIGFLGLVSRTFPTLERAEQWARQCGIFDKCIFTPIIGELLSEFNAVEVTT